MELAVNLRRRACAAGIGMVWIGLAALAANSGNTLPPVKDLHQMPGHAQFHRGVHQPMRGAVVVRLERNVVIDVDLGRYIPGELIARHRQGLKRRPIQCLVRAATASRQTKCGTCNASSIGAVVRVRTVRASGLPWQSG